MFIEDTLGTLAWIFSKLTMCFLAHILFIPFVYNNMIYEGMHATYINFAAMCSNNYTHSQN